MKLDDFNKYFKIKDNAEKQLWNDAIFVFDTSALLEFYYYPQTARQDIFRNLFNPLKERLWITNHSSFEYFKNRESVLEKVYKEKYDKLKSEKIDPFEKDIDSFINSLKDLKQKTQNADKHPFVNQNIFKTIDKTLDKFKSDFNKLKSNCLIEFETRKKEIDSIKSKDEIYEAINTYFKVSERFSFDRIESIILNGEKRFEYKIPPGFEDAIGSDKKDGIQRFGDLIIWHQIIELSIKLNSPIILITNDVKDDWCYVSKRGNEHRIDSPKEDLTLEFLLKTNNQFWMYSFSQFLYLAKSLINLSIKDDSISQIKVVSDEIYKSKIINFDGLYWARSENSDLAYNSFLRFFKGGRVVGVSSTGSPNQVAKWLTDSPTYSSGNYKLEGNIIEFTLISKQGEVHYKGIIQDNNLDLKIKSFINGNTSDLIYEFYRSD